MQQDHAPGWKGARTSVCGTSSRDCVAGMPPVSRPAPAGRPDRDRIEVTVTRITNETQRIKSFELRGVGNGRSMPAFTAGAHVDVHLPGGIVRQYSLCNNPAETGRYVVAVLREEHGRGGSRIFHDQVSVGDRLLISEPRNTFPLVEDFDSYAFFAAGVGITPIMSMCHRLKALGKPFAIHYCARSPEETGFREFLAEMGAERPVAVHHSFGDPSRRLDLRRAIDDLPRGTCLYYCGPTGFMNEMDALTASRDPARVHSERFQAKEPLEQLGGYRVRLARSGAEYLVREGESITDVLLAKGVHVDVSCGSGVCGTCKTRYLSGSPQHNDVILTDEERERYVMICCSGASSPLLVLDLPVDD